MTTEQKAKAYDEAFERAKKLQETCDSQAVVGWCEYLFPELKESEDEKIRKVLIDYFNRYKEQEECGIKTFYGIPTDDILAWLENQGNPTDINPSEFDLRLNKLLKQFETLPKEELANSLSFYLNVVQNDGTYKPDEKQGGQKPVDKVESFDEFEGLTDFERTLADICIGWIGEELGWKQYIKDNADVLLKIAIKKFNSVQDASFEQKSAWSEEDEHRINRISDFIWKNRKGDTDEIYQQEQDVNWLKSLKNKVQPQPKHEWSEEDEEYLRRVINAAKDAYPMTANWLKSLKERYTWKPSDEQMRALHDLNLTGNISYAGQGQVLIELYNDLKKLTE